MPFPTVSVLDNFNRADGGIGSNWNGETNEWEVSGNKARFISYAGWAYWNATSFGSEQEAFFTLDTIHTTIEIDILLKINTDPATYCIEVLYDETNTQIQVFTNNNGSWVNRGTINSVSFSNGDQFGANCNASGLVEVFKNGSSLGTVDCSSYTYYDQGGYIGIWVAGQQGTEYVLFEDFGGGDSVTGTIDTLSKRASIIQLLKPFSIILVIPDGTLDQGDQQHLIWLYSGILAVAVGGQPYILRLHGIPTMGKRDRPGGWN